MIASVFTSEAKSASMWVFNRQPRGAAPVAVEEIERGINALNDLSDGIDAPSVTPDLLPGVPLEVLVIPPSRRIHGEAAEVCAAPPMSGVTPRALRAIGGAIYSEIKATGTNMACLEADDGSVAVAYLPEFRESVMKSFGLTLVFAESAANEAQNG